MAVVLGEVVRYFSLSYLLVRILLSITTILGRAVDQTTLWEINSAMAATGLAFSNDSFILTLSLEVLVLNLEALHQEANTLGLRLIALDKCTVSYRTNQYSLFMRVEDFA